MSPDLHPINTHTHLRPVEQLRSRWPEQESQSWCVHVGEQTATKLQNNTADGGENKQTGNTTFLLKLLMMDLPRCLFFLVEAAKETVPPS